jgi:hypothetical protein
MAHIEDIRDDDSADLPLLARHFYNEYRLPALQLADEAIGKAIEFLPELFPNLPKDGINEFRQLLELERIVKFCQIAENLGAIAVAFKPSYENEKQEIQGIFQTLTEYHVGDVVNFYHDISEQRLEQVATFLGYPFLNWQRSGPLKFLELSCRNVKEDLAQIGALYSDLRLLYDAYKHGYRVAFGKRDSTGDDIIVYADVNKKQKVLFLDKFLKESIHEKSALCYHILNVIFKSHRERVRLEASGTRHGAFIVTLYRRKTDPKPAPDDLNVIYRTRGEMWREDNDAASRIYNVHKTELEKHHPGQFVAIDIDENKIVATNSTIEAVKQDLYKNPPRGRIMFRQVAKTAV